MNILKPYCKLEDGTIEPVYFDNGDNSPYISEARNVYQDDGHWWLDHDVIVKTELGYGIAHCHSKIVAFAMKEEELK